MNLHLAIYLKGFVSTLIIGDDDNYNTPLCCCDLLLCVKFFWSKGVCSGEITLTNNNTTFILEDMRTIMRDQQRDMYSVSNMTSAEVESIKNMTSAQLEVLKDINTTSTKLASQGAYSSLSVFFLGISLVIFGLRLTSKVAPQIGRSMTIIVWALTVPVIILIGLFQYGV